MSDEKAVTIVMVEDDEGHARLIEKNIRRAGVNNEIKSFTSGTPAVDYLLKVGDADRRTWRRLPGSARP
jgi:predicted O-methyltransferase YrrM